jgi:hypothetical protein
MTMKCGHNGRIYGLQASKATSRHVIISRLTGRSTNISILYRPITFIDPYFYGSQLHAADYPSTRCKPLHSPKYYFHPSAI